jgi:hypothetical protein
MAIFTAEGCMDVPPHGCPLVDWPTVLRLLHAAYSRGQLYTRYISTNTTWNTIDVNSYIYVDFGDKPFGLSRFADCHFGDMGPIVFSTCRVEHKVRKSSADLEYQTVLGCCWLIEKESRSLSAERGASPCFIIGSLGDTMHHCRPRSTPHWPMPDVTIYIQ